MSKKIELKPCPFCGADGKLVQDQDHHGEYYTLGCSFTECLANGLFYTEVEIPLEHAIAAWNTRTVDAEKELLIDALKRIQRADFIVHDETLIRMQMQTIAKQALSEKG